MLFRSDVENSIEEDQDLLEEDQYSDIDLKEDDVESLDLPIDNNVNNEINLDNLEQNQDIENSIEDQYEEQYNEIDENDNQLEELDNMKNTYVEQVQDEEKKSMIYESTLARTSKALEKLTNAKNIIGKASNFTQSDEMLKIAAQIMEPKIERWINSYLPDIVEKIVQEEIKKIVPKIED